MARSHGRRRALQTVGGGPGSTLVAVASALTLLLAACSQPVDTTGTAAGPAATTALASASRAAAAKTDPAAPPTTATVAKTPVSRTEPTAGPMTAGTPASRPAASTTGDDSAGNRPAAGTTSSATAAGTGSATGTAGTAGTGTAAFDPHTINWGSISLPPHACAGWAQSAPKNLDYPFVHLSNGKAFIADPDGTTVPGIGPAGWYLAAAGKPLVGQLAGGAPVVVMLLTCAPAGGNMITESIVVFDGSQRGAPYLAIYRPPGGVANGGIRFRDGTIAIDYSTLQAGDARCCPSGKGSTTIDLKSGVLTANWPDAVLAQRAQVVRPGVPTGPGANPTGATATTLADGGPAGRALLPGGGRTVTLTAASGNTYIGTILAEDHITDCMGSATNSAVKAFLAQHPCPHGIYRRLVAIPLHGRLVALSVIQIAAPIGPDTDAHLYDLVSPLATAMRAGGTGGFVDLLAAGHRPAGWPAGIPAAATYAQYGEDLGIQVFRAWYLSGPNSNGDAGLTAMEQDLFLSRITTMGG